MAPKAETIVNLAGVATQIQPESLHEFVDCCHVSFSLANFAATRDMSPSIRDQLRNRLRI
jgi:hypothetical protein